MAENLVDTLANEFNEAYQNPDCSVGLAVIRVLTKLVVESKATTFMGVEQDVSNLQKAIQKKCPKLPLHFTGAAQVFRAGLSKASEALITDWKKVFARHANQCLSDAEKVISLIPKHSDRFLQHGMTIMTRGYDPMVFAALSEAATQGRKFHVLITEGKPLGDGVTLANNLRKRFPHLRITVIPDSAVGLMMNETDAVLLGTDLVLEDGGLLAPVGTYTMSVIASIHRKPVYCMCETFKFNRKFILSTSDLTSMQRKVKYEIDGLDDMSIDWDAREFDFTPAKFVTLLITEKGPMPPSAVTYELTKLLGVS